MAYRGRAHDAPDGHAANERCELPPITPAFTEDDAQREMRRVIKRQLEVASITGDDADRLAEHTARARLDRPRSRRRDPGRGG
jgi:hypothetical protein